MSKETEKENTNNMENIAQTTDPFETYKYGIKREIEKLHPEVRPQVREKLRVICKVTRQTFSAWENYRVDETSSISSDSLALIAKHLNCRLTDLLPVTHQTA